MLIATAALIGSSLVAKTREKRKKKKEEKLGMKKLEDLALTSKKQLWTFSVVHGNFPKIKRRLPCFRAAFCSRCRSGRQRPYQASGATGQSSVECVCI